MSGLRGVLTVAVLIGAVLFVAGFWGFAHSVRTPETPEAPRADAIVALTGAPERLKTAVRLLKQNRAERLLISGVNREVADHELYAALEIDESLAECCVDLGRGAEDTLGNAAETAEWAREHRIGRLILVTDDYHMPRSYAELSIALPEAEIYRYPVRTRFTDPHVWRSDLSAASRLGAEYVKYLMIRGREAVISLSEAKRAPDTASVEKSP